MTDYNSRIERRKKDNKKNKTPKQKKPKKGIFKKVVLSILLLILIGGVAGGIFIYQAIQNAPTLNAKALRDPLSTTILDMHNNKVTTIASTQNRIYTPISKIPKKVQIAFISTEDKRFYQNIGIDFHGIARAVFANFSNGFGAQGASTITQQVVRDSVLTRSKTINRKIQEMYLAIKLNREYSKDQILEMYLNKIYLGEGTYGVATACETYFGVPLDKITIGEAAMLAALPKAPSYYDPFTNLKAAQKRRNVVLDLMASNNVISQKVANEQKAIPLKSLLKKNNNNTNSSKYDAFIQEVEHELVDQKKVITQDEFYKGGLTIYTTLDPKAQTDTDNLLKSLPNKGINYPNKTFDTATALVDTKTGAIRALGGGRNYKHIGDINYAVSHTGTKIQDSGVGSTAKPIVDYGPAIEYMHWSTAHPLVDDPIKYNTGVNVDDWDKKYLGPMNMRVALALSRNVPAVETYQTLLKKEGADKISQFAGGLGFDTNGQFSPSKVKQESYAIGTFTSSPLQMAAAYAAFGDKGIYHEPYTVRKIAFPDGHVVTLDHQVHPAMHEYTAYMITDMLKSVFNMFWQGPYGHETGTGWIIKNELSGIPVAGKTGTNNNTDEWMVGYTTQYSLGVWTGYDNNKQINTSFSAPDPKIARYVFADLLKDVSSKNVPDFKMPNTVVRKTVEASTGLLPSPNTPKSQLDSELFIKGYAPTQVSNKYKKLDPPTNLTTQYDQTNNQLTLSWNYSQQNGTTNSSNTNNSNSSTNSGSSSNSSGGSNSGTNGTTNGSGGSSNNSGTNGASNSSGGSNNSATNGTSNGNVTFEVSQKTQNGKFHVLGTTTQNQIQINQVVPGTTYEFAVVAKPTTKSPSGVDRTSDQAVIQVQIPMNGPNPNGTTNNNSTSNGSSSNNGTPGPGNQGTTNGSGSGTSSGSSNSLGGTTPGSSTGSGSQPGTSTGSNSGSQPGTSTGSSSGSQSSTSNSNNNVLNNILGNSNG